MGNLKFGDISTKDLDLIIQAPPTYDFPQRDVDTVHIPGRNGDLVISKDSFQNTTRTYSLASIFRPGTDFVANSEKLIAWLTSNPGYHRLEDSYDPEVYRIACFNSKGSLQNYYDKATVLNISFNCKPQRFLKTGEKLKEYTFDQVTSLDDFNITIENPTYYKSEPIIIIEDLDEDTTPNRVLMMSVINYKEEVVASLTINSLDIDSLIIDSEKQIVYSVKDNDIINRNNIVNLNKKDFPKFDRSKNRIELRKFNSVSSMIDKYESLLANKMQTCFAKCLPFEKILESKQHKATIISYEKLKERFEENYTMGSYLNLMLEKSKYGEIVSFNTMMQSKCYMVSFNCDVFGQDKDKINIISKNSSDQVTLNGKISSNLMTSDVKTIDGLVAICYNDKTNKYSLYVIQSTGVLTTGCYVILKDVTNTSYDMSKILFLQTISLNNFISPQFVNQYLFGGNCRQNLLNANKKFEAKSLENLYENEGIDNLSHDIVLQIYPTTATSTESGKDSKQLDVDIENIPEFMKVEITYEYTEDGIFTGQYALTTLKSILYKPKSPGYYYKDPSVGNGLLSALTSGISKLLNKSGWSYIRELDIEGNTTVLEEAKWSTTKKVFTLGNAIQSMASIIGGLFGATEEEYVVSRNYLSEIPQYEDLELDGTYETDSNGNPITDIAGNKINKVIKSRIRIGTIDTSSNIITDATHIDAGYYKINDGNWYYANSDQPLVISSSSDFKQSFNATNEIYYLKEVPTYDGIDDFPEWLNPEPKLMKENGIEAVTGNEKLNAYWYDFFIKEEGWYWYDYMDGETKKRTVYNDEDENYKESGYLIGVISPQSSDPDIKGRKVEDDFVVYYIEPKNQDGRDPVFPIHEYEYCDAIHSTYGQYIFNQLGISFYNTSVTYDEGDYVYQSDNISSPTEYLIYKCRENDVTGTWNPSKWDVIGIYVKAEEFKEGLSYGGIGSYTIYDRKLWKSIYSTRPQQISSWNPDEWIEIGNYIKNIGFYYLTDSGNEEEIEFNLVPDWLKIDINPGISDDFADTYLEFKASESLDSEADNLYKYDSNTIWTKKVADETLISTPYKIDTYMYYIDYLPQYSDYGEYDEYTDIYSLSVVQSLEGNPEKVLVKPNQNGYYKIGSSVNYQYNKEDETIYEMNIHENLNIVYLDQVQTSQEEVDKLKNVKISIKPRWWSL